MDDTADTESTNEKNNDDNLRKRTSLYIESLTSGNNLESEGQALLILLEFIQSPAKCPLDVLVKHTLGLYLIGEEPFPMIKEDAKPKRGRASHDICPSKYQYYYYKTKSINRTAKLLGVSNKTVRDRLPCYQELKETMYNLSNNPELSTHADKLVLALDCLYRNGFDSDSIKLEAKS